MHSYVVTDFVVSGPPSSLNISNIGVEADTFNVSWKLPTQPNGVIRGYEVQYRISSDLEFMSVNTTNTSINLTSLITGVNYTVRVRAMNAAGLGNFTNNLTVLNSKKLRSYIYLRIIIICVYVCMKYIISSKT